MNQRLALLSILWVISAACTSPGTSSETSGTETPPRPSGTTSVSPSPEGIDLPQWQEAEPLPRPKANPRPPVQTDGGVNFYPSSARVEPGVAYQMELYLHCGYSPIDFDGTFWFPRYQKRDLRRLRRVDGEFPTGSILLLKENLALFESNSGVQVSLDRSHGPWSGWYCE